MKTCLLILFSFLFLQLSSQTVRYVQPVSSGVGDGSSWANASNDLQAMITASAANDEVWVAAGTYLPGADINGNTSPADTRTKTFILKQAVKVYGGFAGTETTLSQRDFVANLTTLSGDIGTSGDNIDNCYHIITNFDNGLSLATRLDGFTLTKGNADVQGKDANLIPREKGAAIYTEGNSGVFNSISIYNCIFTNNHAFSEGGALFFDLSNSDLRNCDFISNSSLAKGGAVCIRAQGLSFFKCRFRSNTSFFGGAIESLGTGNVYLECDFISNHAGFTGGAITNRQGAPCVMTNCSFVSNSSELGGALLQSQQNILITNCLFSLNTALTLGGAADFYSCTSSIINTTIVQNSCTGPTGDGGGLLYDDGASGVIINSILWNNTSVGNPTPNREEIFKYNNNGVLTVSKSIVKDYNPVNSVNIAWGSGISTADPLFINPADPDGADNIIRTPDDGLALQTASPAINAGDNTAIPAGITTDITGSPRISSAIVDLGAYERSLRCTPASFRACPSNMSVNTLPGQCTAAVTYTALVAGNPFPTLTYNFSGATTGGGPGSGSGKIFNKGITTVTLTVFNGCTAAATCRFTVTVADSEAPVISAQPADFTVCETGTATFSVTSSNTVSYQWQIKRGNNWIDILGETTSSLTLTGVSRAMSNTEYRVLVNGLCTAVTSAVARLIVNPKPTVSVVATGFWTLWPNQSININATVNPPGGVYVWYLNGNVLPGVTGPSVNNITVEKTGRYKVVYTTASGCVNTSGEINVTAQPSAKLWVYPNPNQGTFQVRYFNDANEKLLMKMYNDAGQVVYSTIAATTYPYTRIDVDLDGRLSHGIYTIKLFREDGTLGGTTQVLIGHK